MNNATNFALDFQEDHSTHNPEGFKQLVEKYGAQRLDESLVLTFPDQSTAEWIEEEHSWKVS